MQVLKINHESPISLHAQVEELLRELIQQPEYQNGALLPEEMRLAAKLGISRGTVRSGITKLVHEGLLERKAGVGTRIAKRPAESGIMAWRSFSREMAAKGISVQNFKVAFQMVKINADVARCLQITDQSKVWKLERIRGWNDKPVLQTISWFHPRLRLKGTEEFKQPLYELIENLSGTIPHHARETFSAVTTDQHLSQLLEVPTGTSLLLRRHTVFDPGDRPFEYAEIRYVSSRFELTLELSRNK
jgi:GntR family transcriptional regulator